MWTYWWIFKKWQKVHVRLIFLSQEDQNKFKRGNKNKSFRAMPSLLNMVGKWFTSIAYTPPPIDQCVKVKSRSIQLRGIYFGLPPPPKGINCCFWTKKEKFYFQVSISPTIYEQLFCKKIDLLSLFYLQFGFVIFLTKEYQRTNSS